MEVFQFNSLFNYMPSSTASELAITELARIETTAAVRQHRTKQTKNKEK
jgi:hypothetical protein